jgi:hypothetical protein
MHQQLWGYKVEWKSVSRGTGGKRLNTTALGLHVAPVSQCYREVPQIKFGNSGPYPCKHVLTEYALDLRIG